MLIAGRYDESRGDPQIIADTLSLDFAAGAGDLNAAPADDAEPAWADAPPEAPDDMLAAIESEPPPDFDEPPPDFDAAPAVERPPRSADEDEDEPAWVNGDDKLPMPDEKPSESLPSRTISVTLVATDDAAKDGRKLDRLHNVFVKYPGGDHFKIIIIRDDKTMPLRFPKQSTGICPDLERDLAEIVGSAEFITVDET